MKPRLHLSPSAPLAAPIAKAPAYQKGLSLLDVLTKLIYTLLAPGEMIELLIRGTLHLCFDILVARNRGVALVEGLRGHFARVINRASGPLRAAFERHSDRHQDVFRRIFAGGTTRRRGYRAQRVVCTRLSKRSRGVSRRLFMPGL